MKSKKGVLTQLLEYGAVSVLLMFTRLIPLKAVHAISSFLGYLFFHLVRKRRSIAIENLSYALGTEITTSEIHRIALESCTSFFLTFLEGSKFQHLLLKPGALEDFRKSSKELDRLFLKAKKLHDESGGCIFVTPHIGNWELLPYVSSMVGIELVVVVRPLDNIYLEKLLYKDRTGSGQIIIPKKNALFVLQKMLQQGKSIGMLPDQSTMRGISVDFFGRKATTTPIPAMLSVMYGKPIVVVACCRTQNRQGFEGFVSDPIRPGSYQSEKDEIIRLTREINKHMETIIRKYPHQYLWMHKRWKTYKDKKEIMS